jgi:hypothetical protein
LRRENSSARKVACAIASSFVLGYVIEGEFRFGIDGETPSDLPAGQAFWRTTRRLYTVSSGARPDQAAKVLAVIIAPADKV